VQWSHVGPDQHSYQHTGWLKKSKLLYCVNSLLFLSHPVVGLRWARLELGWVTVCGFESQCTILVFDQPPILTQPGYPSMGRHIEYH